MTITIQATRADDWQQVRDLRLEMLANEPMAYAESLDDARPLGEDAWRLRGARGQSETGTALVAVAEDGRWVGGMGCFIPEDSPDPLLVGVYVSPNYRVQGAGVAEALLNGIKAWASTRGNVLRLEVHEDNLRAQRFYLRNGFTFTGGKRPYNLNPEQTELEMSCPLA
ncbi:GNAT family N-acetyltransferase [Pseudarthrobacter sp. J75]|uniref:GNAT family N-acetyltransferase n=1 Tax=unclassified Pseudarthrobacter TaxID=2647000 RepID=UPI002E8247A4|nr:MULTISPECIES: GNAT family N-acetyltransferase [unclassified Pseudarthrobacter]MEE2524102.1 GNAT family N-acetyltransferase [Pseudarthrobacter sp. J47]MEE2530381.1 GNAT family N-acetyltransferase [Pseudarthrobacter sp. J75]MEE2568847.1 GNAT family N-acetyltransferase [Pseudarthrobacter sp. J64]